MSYALIAILLWSMLASLVAQLAHIPPFLLTGIALSIGSVIFIPQWRLWRLPTKTLLTGIAALFFYHAALFTAFKSAPVVSANLINYLWPLLIVVLAPLFDRQQKLVGRTIVAAIMGFSGAAIAIVGDQLIQVNVQAFWGYLLALIAAVTWSSYTLQLRRLPSFPSAAVGGFNLTAGVLSLSTGLVFETLPPINLHDICLLIVIGVGPMGLAFYCWDKAAKQLLAKTLGTLCFITPVLSTTLLLLSSGQSIRAHLLLAAALVLSAIALVLQPVKSSAAQN